VKFKAVFILFNAVVLLSFLFIFLMPLFFLGWQYTQLFWAENWYLALIFVAILAGLNGYFISNWKLFSFLEREDWSALAAYLEERIFRKKVFRAQEIRLLIHSYIALNRPSDVKNIEATLREEKPALLDRFALAFGVPHLLSNNGEEMVSYFGEMKDRAPQSKRPWARWAYGFGLMLSGSTEEAKPVLREAADEAGKDPLLELVTLYLLDAFREHDEEIRDLIHRRREALRNRHEREKVERLLERNRGELHILVVSKLIQSAMDWCYGERS
jgi:signal transduction histidine kinase